jgi:hypothetical protein
MSKSNDVTLFSNGIGHFRRVYKVPAGKDATAFSIPFKRDHIGDVAASLQVFGKVRLNKPPSFTPSNANATALNIVQSEALKSLLRSLSGAQVKVKYTNSTEKSYTLLGLDTDTQVVDGNEVQKDYIVLMSGGSVKRKPLFEVEDVHFEDEGVRTEIDKALKNNFQLIKPDSTLLDLSLAPLGDGDTEAVIQYTIPVAAWKMRYAIRQEGDQFSLEGAAIIDNNTDEDWDNFRVSVVTGNPISFNTDIATVVVPQRKTVRLVDNQALGNVEVQDAYAVAACAAPIGGGFESAGGRGLAKRAAARGLGPKMSTANYAQFGMTADCELESVSESQCLEAAESAGVESKEVGDFCVFTSKEPITILARKSAVVPMFTVPLTKAGVVLLYKESNNARRPYRTVKFKNETEFSLGKGKTVIYNSGVFSGECVLDTAKPGENRMLPHCLENGVKIAKETKPTENKRLSLKISDGVGITEDVYTAVSTYKIENKKDEKFKIALEHTNQLGGANTNVDFDGVEVKEKEKLADGTGYRLYFELAPKQSVDLVVTETSVASQKVSIGHYYSWLRQNVIDVKNPLAKDKQVQVCVKLQEKIDGLNAEINEAAERREELTEQGERVRQNLAAAKDVGNSTTVSEWVADLDKTEKEIRKIDKEITPALNKKVKEATAELQEALKEITADWKAEKASKASK